MTAIWGQAARWLPGPLSDWHDLPYRTLGAWWHGLLPATVDRDTQLALFQTLAAYVFALLLPLVAMRAVGLNAGAAGLGWNRRGGWAITLAGVILVQPVGFWLVASTPRPWGAPLYELLGYLSMLPEHFLVFGVAGVLLAGEGRLAWRAGWSSGFTLCALALLFGLLHVGTPHAVELWTAFPLGALFAAMTLISASIWPALFAHVALNLVPLAWWTWGR